MPEFSAGNFVGFFPAHKQLLSEISRIPCHKEGQKLFWPGNFFRIGVIRFWLWL